MPMDVSVRELKNRLSEYLRRAQAGEEVHVTLRGKRIVRLSREPETEESRRDEALARLDAMPWIRTPKREGKPVGATPPLRITARSEELVRWLRE